MVYLIAQIIQLLLAFFIFFLCISFVTGAPFVPSANRTAIKMIELADIKTGDIIYDLGSGNGKLLFLAAAKGARAIGYEINPFLVLTTRFRALLSPYRRSIVVHWGNLWKAQLPGANIVFVYLLPWRMNELQNKLSKELKPGSRVISNSFIFPNWKSSQKNIEDHVYLYKV